MTCSDATESATATAVLRLALGSARRPYGLVPVVRYSAGYKDTGNRDSGVSRKRSKYRHEVFNTVSFPVASRSMPGHGSATEGDSTRALSTHPPIPFDQPCLVALHFLSALGGLGWAR